MGVKGILFTLETIPFTVPQRDKGWSEFMNEAKEVKIPAILVAVALLSTAIYSLKASSLDPVAGLVNNLIVGVPAALIACMIVGGLVGISFGNFNTAWIKFAAIYTVRYGIELWVPERWAEMISFLLYYAFLYWLFDLDGFEPLFFSAVLLGVILFLSAVTPFRFLG